MTVASQARPSLEVMEIGDALETILLVLAADKAALQHALVLDRDRTGQDAPAKPAARDADRGQGGRGRRGAAGGAGGPRGGQAEPRGERGKPKVGFTLVLPARPLG